MPFYFYFLDGYAPFLSFTSRLTSFSESKDSVPAPGQYDCTPVKVLQPRDIHLLITYFLGAYFCLIPSAGIPPRTAGSVHLRTRNQPLQYVYLKYFPKDFNLFIYFSLLWMAADNIGVIQQKPNNINKFFECMLCFSPSKGCWNLYQSQGEGSGPVTEPQGVTHNLSHSRTNQSCQLIYILYLECGRRTEHIEETHTDTVRTCKLHIKTALYCGAVHVLDKSTNKETDEIWKERKWLCVHISNVMMFSVVFVSNFASLVKHPWWLQSPEPLQAFSGGSVRSSRPWKLQCSSCSGTEHLQGCECKELWETGRHLGESETFQGNK